MLTLHFLLSFLRFSSSIKSSFLEEQHQREAFLSIFKGLSGDPLSVVRETLEVLWADVWCDVKVRRTLKVGVFGEGTMKHVSINFSLSFAFRLRTNGVVIVDSSLSYTNACPPKARERSQRQRAEFPQTSCTTSSLLYAHIEVVASASPTVDGTLVNPLTLPSLPNITPPNPMAPIKEEAREAVEENCTTKFSFSYCVLSRRPRTRCSAPSPLQSFRPLPSLSLLISQLQALPLNHGSPPSGSRTCHSSGISSGMRFQNGVFCSLLSPPPLRPVP